MAGRLAEILRQEYKTKGFVPGLASATGKAALEKLDLRNLLFGGSGFGSVIGRKIFGKGYSATQGDAPFVSQKSFEPDNSLADIRNYSALSARNSMALPIIASQINIMQKNVAKLVKIQGVSPSQRADAFFSSAKFRENAYEQALREGRTRTPTPLIAPQKKDSSLGLLSFLALAGGALALFGDQLGTATRTIAGVIGALATFGLALKAIAIAQGVKNILTGPGGVPVPTPGQKGKIPKGRSPKRISRFGLAVGAITGGLLGSQLTKDTDQDFDPTTGEKIDQGMSGLEGAAIGIAAGAGTYAARTLVQPKLDARVQSKMGAPIEFDQKTSRFTQNRKFISAKDLPLEKTLERLRNYYSTISKTPGLKSYFLKKLVAKFGIGATLRIGAFLGGLAAAPFTAGLSTIISLASWGLNAYLLYEIYDWLFGEENNAEKIEETFKLENSKKEFEKDAQRSLEQEKKESRGPIQLAGPGTPAIGDMPSEETTGGETSQGTKQYGRLSSVPKKQEPKKYPARFSSLGKSSPETEDSQVEQILATIRKVESGNNYTAQNPAGSASGAYQYINSTWQAVTKKYGIGTEYERAKDAPPEIQDEVARRNVKDILKQVNGDVSKVPNVWYTGNAEGRMTPEQLAANNGLTSEQYQQKWMTAYGQAPQTQVASAADTNQSPQSKKQYGRMASLSPSEETSERVSNSNTNKKQYGRLASLSPPTQVALVPKENGKGSIIQQNSVQVNDANRELSSSASSPAIINQDNRVVNNQSSSQTGGATVSVYDTELISSLIDQSAYYAT